MPTPQQRIEKPTTVWQRVTLPCYDRRPHELDIATGTALWFHFGLPGVHIRLVLIRDAAGQFDPQALLSTDLTLTPEFILACFMRRWPMEPTFRPVRKHLGVLAQRQWSDKAIARTTPALLGLFSLITLLANARIARHRFSIRSAAWYPKPLPTFSDAPALVRRHLWAYLTFQISADQPDMIKVPRVILERFQDALCYAA